MQIPLYQATNGLNNKVDSVRLKFNPETGISSLAEAVNISIDPTGRISRQKGTSLLVSGDYHSLCPFDIGGYSLAMSDTSLYAIDEAGNTTGIRSGMTPFVRVDYEAASDGTKDYIYYVNGNERGRVWDKVSYVWNVTDYVGPDTTKTFEGPPSGAHLLTLFNGRMYLAVDNVVFASEFQDYHKYIYSNNIHFRGRVAMLQGMEGGLFVSDSKHVYFLSGQDITAGGSWEPFTLRTKADSPMVEGCYVKMEAEYLGESEGHVLFWYSNKGVYAGYDDGRVVNLTKNKLTDRDPAIGTNYLPTGEFGAMAILNNEQLILTVEP